MKILMLCYEFPPLGGGGSYVVHGLSRALVDLGCSVDLVTMGFRGLPPFEEVNGVRVHRVACIRTRQSICYVPELAFWVACSRAAARRLARASRFDINHTHFIFPDGLIARSLKQTEGLPFVITAHGSDVPGYNPDRFKLAHRLMSPAWRGVVGEASAVVFSTQSLARLARDAGAGPNYSVIPHGFDADGFASATGCERDPRRILMISRLFARKGAQYLLRAVAGLERDYELHVVGDGPHLPTLRRLAQSLGARVQFHGWLDNRSEEFRRLLETSAIFVLPSESENFPVVLQEAMAAGLPIIAIGGTGSEEVVGDAGLMVPPRDVDALRGALHRLLDEPVLRDTLGSRARARLEAKFTWRAVAEQYLDVYRTCAG